MILCPKLCLYSKVKLYSYLIQNMNMSLMTGKIQKAVESAMHVKATHNRPYPE